MSDSNTHSQPNSDWLRGVEAGPTKVAYVEPNGSLFYRGYQISSICDRHTYEDVAFLLLNEKWPRQSEAEYFRENLVRNRKLPWRVAHLCHVLCERHNMMPIDAFIVLINVLRAHSDTADATDKKANIDKAAQLIAQMPSVMGMISNSQNLWRQPDDSTLTATTKFSKHIQNVRSNEIVEGQISDADTDAIGWPIGTSYTQSGYVYLMATGSPPSAEHSDIIDKIMVLYAEHGFAASTFAARVVASTKSDLHNAITAALTALKGPLHGGAAEQCADLIQNNLKDPREVERIVTAQPFITGFGHPVYKNTDDPRVQLMDDLIQQYKDFLIHESKRVWGPNAPDWLTHASRFREAVERRFEGHIRANVEYPISLVLTMLGIDKQLYPMIFGIARTAGWSAHIIEHQSYRRTPIIRPLARYEGTTHD